MPLPHSYQTLPQERPWIQTVSPWPLILPLQALYTVSSALPPLSA